MNASIWHPLLANASFFLTLLSIDRELAKKCKDSKCPYCGGVLHAGFYQRKIRIDVATPEISLCFSFCCKQKDCRKRTTPLSVRFCRGSPYPLAAVAIAELFAKGASHKRVSEVCKLLAVSERTVRRWFKSWRDITTTSWWRERLGHGLPEWKESGLVRVALSFAVNTIDIQSSFCAFLRDLSVLRFRF